ncbi:hypothetical protein OSB04_025155 [Centaurea solstitialis]|uniref:UspA domain-containing protein n=1 Tax=Centaurea solstitialis TaxID=347529 RepID=A0AA38SV49_9ASTR|nr:hypothetical protein OSB04_025155 [Centaurea solstitialis]
MAEKQVIVVGFDDSAHSRYALDWTLEHFFTNQATKSLFKLIIVNAKVAPVSVLGLAGPASTEVYSLEEVDLQKKSEKASQTAMEICKAKSVNVQVDDVTVVTEEGDPRTVICDAIDKYKASFLVVGSHGYGPIKRYHFQGNLVKIDQDQETNESVLQSTDPVH